ncbi:MAG: Fimbrial assembly family protein [Candidatus Saccharibacteria bacterium]|nr:Fimbrial assembly family protein [Candidatus Saccharibacteria bacterium]
MINLMPDDAKKEIHSARLNVILSRYIIVILFAFGFLVLLLAGSYVVLTQTKQTAQRLIDANGTKADVYSSTKAQVEALSSSLSQTKTILDQEVLYSNVLMHIAQQMPAGTVLSGITLNAASFTGTPVTLKAYAKTTDDAVALRQKFQSSPIFTNVNFDSVSDSAGIKDYPIGVSMTLTVTKAAAQ